MPPQSEDLVGTSFFAALICKGPKDYMNTRILSKPMVSASLPLLDSRVLEPECRILVFVSYHTT